ncbi:SDR family NAD(P)-dependent oxidoreductase [Rhodococcus sp. SBT000017]|uniref:SDR family oxidoreductase n=1 Tax=Rhodococcus sp. SBT000017 TaxID=1803385 RepID=UPI000EF85757|nr:SDR family NAD(P)-dependent oxidoreductase [Rhodococcus sp. SBT000017]RMB77574.1 SDR family NAD(P)-dependent oxidoreductase [Rhodococcus sp. SBT000017]
MIGRRRPHLKPSDDDVVLITGATSGIGAGLATRFHAREAHVVITGRDPERLSAMAAEHPGMTAIVMDVCDPESVRRAMADIAASIPHLTTLINNAGVQRPLDFSAQERPAIAEIADEIATNFTGLVDVSSAALPLLRLAPRARVVHVGFGLGFVPLAGAPVYSATKAAVHSFTVSLRHQLRRTTVQVVELVPPVVDHRCTAA